MARPSVFKFVTSLTVLLLVIASACAARPTDPLQKAPVRLTVRADKTEVARGATAVLTSRLENLTNEALTLHFGSACQVMPYIAKDRANGIVYPSGGEWGCAAVVTELTLPPNGFVEKELQVIAGEASGDRVGLPPGEYVFFARLQDRVYKLESARVSFSVQ